MHGRDDPGVSTVRSGTALTVAIIGPGRAGTALGLALVAAGHRVSALYARSPDGRRHAAAVFPGATVSATPTAAVALAEVILLGVPDDRIAEVATQIAPAVAARRAHHRLVGPGPLVVHLSGRYGTAPLGPVAAAGARVAAIHPIMTLSGALVDADRLAGTTFGVTTAAGDGDTAELVRHLVEGLGGQVAVIPEENRAIYHAAMVLGGNFGATLATAAGRLAAAAGVPDPSGALGPLLRTSLDNALAGGERTMTGPVRRGDADAVATQRTALARLDPHLADAYAALAVLTADLLETAGLLGAEAADGIRAAGSRGHPRA